MRNRVEIVGIKIDNITIEEGTIIAANFLDGNGCKTIFTPNSEILIDAVKDVEFGEILNAADLVIPDGIGVVIASKFYGTPLKEKVAGFDLMNKILELANENNNKIYFLGGKEGVAKEAAEKVAIEHPNIDIVGIRNGYFDEQDEIEIIDQINSSGADILFAALGAPKQEKFIYNYREKLNVKIAMGVGGSLDVLAGRMERAPEVYQKAGLEWFYRLKKDPRRIGRMTKLPKFIVLAFLDAKLR